MKYLLDVNALISLLHATHQQHATADNWAAGKDLVLCPTAELGFLRISSHPRGLRQTMADAELALAQFKKEQRVSFIPDDLSADGLGAPNSDAVTDTYLAKLAVRHNLRLAAFDQGIKHPAVELIA